jgi:predicted RNase H-like HicB family nuclease
MDKARTEYYVALPHPLYVEQRNGLYVVSVICWPNCEATGKTFEQASNNLRTAKTEWLRARVASGLEIPEPHFSMEDAHKKFAGVIAACRAEVVETAVRLGVTADFRKHDSIAECVELIVASKVVEKKRSKKGSRKAAATVSSID